MNKKYIEVGVRSFIAQGLNRAVRHMEAKVGHIHLTSVDARTYKSAINKITKTLTRAIMRTSVIS